MSVCPKCGDPIPSTHSRRLGGLIDRRRKCKCGHIDRVLVQPEKIVKVLSVDARQQTLQLRGRKGTKTLP